MDEQRQLAKSLLVNCLRLPNGIAARQAEAFTKEQLKSVCAVADEPLRARRQVLKAVLSNFEEKRRIAKDAAGSPAKQEATQPPETPPLQEEEQPAGDPPQADGGNEPGEPPPQEATAAVE